jgi:hypothetical protein
MPTMGDIRIHHSLCCHPWQSSTNSGTTLPLTIPWAALCSIGFCFFTRRGEFYCFLYQWELKQFFSDTGNICRRLCHCPWLLVAHSEAMRMLNTPYLVLHMRNLQKFVLWGLL